MMLLKWYTYVGAFRCRLHVPNAFGGKARLEVDASCIFPQDVLAATTFVKGGSRDGGQELEPAVKWDVPCSVAIVAWSGGKPDPSLLE